MNVGYCVVLGDEPAEKDVYPVGIVSGRTWGLDNGHLLVGWGCHTFFDYVFWNSVYLPIENFPIFGVGLTIFRVHLGGPYQISLAP